MFLSELTVTFQQISSLRHLLPLSAYIRLTFTHHYYIQTSNHCSQMAGTIISQNQFSFLSELDFLLKSDYVPIKIDG